MMTCGFWSFFGSALYRAETMRTRQRARPEDGGGEEVRTDREVVDRTFHSECRLGVSLGDSSWGGRGGSMARRSQSAVDSEKEEGMCLGKHALVSYLERF